MLVSARRPVDLPDFLKPPLVETVLSLQFKPLEKLTVAHVGLLWQRFRQEFPHVEERPPLPPMFEKFGPPSTPEPEVSITEKPPLPRVWFLNEDRTQLIQVQADRFIHNWRKTFGITPYPRYEPIRDKFRAEVDILEQFLNEEGLGSLDINQCEVAYVNQIEPSGVWDRHGELHRVLKYWVLPSDHLFLPEPESVGVRLRFVILGQDNKPIGRLHAGVEPAWRQQDNLRIIVLNITARGVPVGVGVDGAFDFFDLGREWIVKGFADLTSREMHRAWERTNG
jgi:uncharacterized protein (TIGR04255 family)